jgi:predicted ATP-dependent protease
MRDKEHSAKYETTLYLTEENRQKLKQRLLESLDQGLRIPVRGKGVVEVARELRHEASQDAVDY